MKTIYYCDELYRYMKDYEGDEFNTQYTLLQMNFINDNNMNMDSHMYTDKYGTK
jgi:hypothetical protein